MSLRSQRRAKQQTEGPIDCELYEEHLLPDENSTDTDLGIGDEDEDGTWVCQDEELLVYKIVGLPKGFLKSNGAKSGKSKLKANKGIKNRGVDSGDNIVLDLAAGGLEVTPKDKNKDKKDKKDNGNRRRLAETGTRSVLVLRSIPPDVQCDHTAVTMADNVFGTIQDPANLVSQYAACSGGQLNFEMATGTNIVDGVAEIPITQNVNNVNRITAHNYVVSAAPSVVGSLSQWDYVMVVLPNQVDFEGSLAYAYINHWLSVYRDDQYYKMMVQMHEVSPSLMVNSVKAFESALLIQLIIDLCFDRRLFWRLLWPPKVGHNLGMYHSGEGQAT